MYQAILFDLDHTLLMPEVSVQEKLLALDVAGEPLYDAASAREAHRQAELWTARQILHELETNTRMEDDLFLEQVLSIYRKESNVHSDAAKELIDAAILQRSPSNPEPEVYTLLESLQTKYILGVVSNNSTKIRNILQEFNLTPYFAVVTISAEVGLEKPDPRIMHHTCEAIQVKPTECLYIGDHPFDVLCANRAGMDCAWLDHGIFRCEDLPVVPKYTLHTLTDVTAILEPPEA